PSRTRRDVSASRFETRGGCLSRGAPFSLQRTRDRRHSPGAHSPQEEVTEAMKRPLDTVIELQDALRRLRRIEAHLGGIPDWLKELDEEYQARRQEIDELEHQAEAGRIERRTAEAGISDAQEKLRRYQRQINEVTTQREYGALLQEIDTV